MTDEEKARWQEMQKKYQLTDVADDLWNQTPELPDLKLAEAAPIPEADKEAPEEEKAEEKAEEKTAGEKKTKADQPKEESMSAAARSATLAGMTLNRLSQMIHNFTEELQRDDAIELPEDWGVPQTSPREQPAGNTAKPAEAGEPAAEAIPEEAPAAEAEAQKEQVFDFEQVWKIADETVEWTEALNGTYPPPGTYDNIASFLQEKAPAVLKGDREAYLDVIAAARPLDDLLTWAVSAEINTVEADRLNANFAGSVTHSGEDRDRYMAGMCLRVARDLFALLPIREVQVEGTLPGWGTIRVNFERRELQKVAFAFIDPVEFVKTCGAEFSKE